jgi:hypothetical protein
MRTTTVCAPPPRRRAPLLLAFIVAAAGACTPQRDKPAPEPPTLTGTAQELTRQSGTTTNTPIGLAVRIEDGKGVPLQVRAGQTFYIDQIDLRASLAASMDEGVAGLGRTGDFSGLAWRGVTLADSSAEDAPNPDGTFTGRRFYRGARWMEAPSTFTFTQLDATGAPAAAPMVVSAGADDERHQSDGFFVRRMRAIQWAFDCATRDAWPTAHAFQEEALVELRNSVQKDATFAIAPATSALRVEWSANPGRPYTIPITQIAAPTWDYGFAIDLWAVTPPRPDGTYAPGTDVTFQVQLRDGAGKALHAPGVLPSLNAVLSGAEPSGIQYWRGLVEKFATYYRRKHMERQLVGQIIGPAQEVRPIRSLLDLATGLTPDGVVRVGTTARDGFFAQGYELPSFTTIFAGLGDPAHAAWDAPVPATFTFPIEADAKPGTYLVTQKGRRVYLGQDIPSTTTIEIQVGTPKHTSVNLTTGECAMCHRGDTSLSVLLHANDDRGACAACHAPLTMELEGPVYVRTHFLHSRSDRVGASVGRCNICHLTLAGIQRTSKSACQSCHASYPKSHVAEFGPITNMYVGTETGAFDVCTTRCHKNHPSSGLR